MTATSVPFLGGPLDGRVQDLADAELTPGNILRHVYLHDGPKIETEYELGFCLESGWAYRLHEPGRYANTDGL